MNRQVKPELLDSLSPGDPLAIGSRRDLHRINGWMGNHRILTRALEENSSSAPRGIIELGAGDGLFLLSVAKRMSNKWRDVKVTLLDLQNNVSSETVALFHPLGWRAKAVVADVFDWNPPREEKEVMVTNLFLHHFEEPQLRKLLLKVSQNTNLFVAVEPYRFRYPQLVGKLLWLIACNRVTRHDAVVSIRAGFAGKELSALWPGPAEWHLTERRAGWASHVFIAKRRE